MAYTVKIRGGSHPRFVDYACSQCNEQMFDVFFPSYDAVTATHPCPCGAKADRVLVASRGNHIHATHSSMYGKYHAGLDCVITDYAHKQRVMREQGVMEGADPVKGSRNHWKPTPERPAEVPGSHWVDTPGEIEL